MSIPKIKGIETEWSVIFKGKKKYLPAKISHFETMMGIIRNYFQFPTLSREESLGEIENIGRVSRRDLSMRYRDPVPSFSSWHGLLPNGARLYIDGPHIEYSTAECLSARTLVAADKAGETTLNLARIGINKSLASEEEEIVVYKDSSDGKGSSYGCHENYLVSREAFDKIVNPGPELGYLASYFICRQIFAGAGKVGIEAKGERVNESIYQISQRADFIRELLSLCTTDRRAIVNTRDEPLADGKRFGRLHVIVGEANMAEISTYMKVGITSIILKMIEDGFLEGDIIIENPVETIKRVSLDLTCKKPTLETRSGRKLSSLDLNEEFFEKAQNYLSKISEPSSEEKDLMQKWEETISDFRTGNEARLRRRFDWKIKQAILNSFLEAYDISWENVEKAVIKDGRRSYKVSNQLFKKDLLYHNINKEEGRYWAHKEAGELEEIVSREEVIELVKNPPPECRSYFRGRCLAKFLAEIDVADWDGILFSDKQERKSSGDFSIFYDRLGIDLSNPIWGGKADTEEILEKSETHDDLIKNLRKGG